MSEPNRELPPDLDFADPETVPELWRSLPGWCVYRLVRRDGKRAADFHDPLTGARLAEPSVLPPWSYAQALEAHRSGKWDGIEHTLGEPFLTTDKGDHVEALFNVGGRVIRLRSFPLPKGGAN